MAEDSKQLDPIAQSMANDNLEREKALHSNGVHNLELLARVKERGGDLAESLEAAKLKAQDGNFLERMSAPIMGLPVKEAELLHQAGVAVGSAVDKVENTAKSFWDSAVNAVSSVASSISDAGHAVASTVKRGLEAQGQAAIEESNASLVMANSITGGVRAAKDAAIGGAADGLEAAVHGLRGLTSQGVAEAHTAPVPQNLPPRPVAQNASIEI